MVCEVIRWFIAERKPRPRHLLSRYTKTYLWDFTLEYAETTRQYDAHFPEILAGAAERAHL